MPELKVNDRENSQTSCGGTAMIKIPEQRIGESRADYMLKVAAAYIKYHCSDETIFYDDAECDGYCVAEDCLNAIEKLL